MAPDRHHVAEIADALSGSLGAPTAQVQGGEPLAAALQRIADRLRESFGVDLAVLRLTAGEPGEEDVRAHSFADATHEQALAPAMARMPRGALGIARSAMAAGHAVVWPDLLAEAVSLSLVDDRATTTSPDALARVLAGGSAVAMPLATSSSPRLGVVTLVSLRPDRVLGEEDREALEEVAPEIALAVQAAQLGDRNRRIRHTLEAVLETTQNGIVVADLRGRLAIANRAAGELLGMDLQPYVGTSMVDLVGRGLKWRFADPEGAERRQVRLVERPDEAVRDEVETVDGRLLERYSAPVRSSGGDLLGRVDILTDVTEQRAALAEARRLAEEKAALLEREERRAQEEVALTRAGHVMASALTRADIHEHLLSQAQRIAGADKAAVLVVDPTGDVLPAAAAGFSDDSLKRMSYRRGEGIVGRVVESQRAFICNDAEADPRVAAALFRQEGVRSFMHVPLVLGERIYGVLNVDSLRPRAFGERELRVLTELCRHAAAALQNAMQFEQERHIAETLQRSLLTEDLPSVPGLSLAALYRASAGSLVGGDTYSVWRLPGGEVALLVGDVSGKGVDAAGITAMVRYMLEGLSLRERDPAVMLTELNRLLVARIPDASLVTAFLAVLDADLGGLQWCNAGHPPPMLVTAQGDAHALGDPGPPCGAFQDSVYRRHEVPLEPGDLVFLYTDGLVEARRHGETFGEERVREAILDATDLPPAELARAVYAAVRVWSSGLIADDVAIAVVKRDAVDVAAPDRGPGAARSFYDVTK